MLVYVDAAYVECGYAVIARRAYDCISVPWVAESGAELCCAAAIGMPGFQKLHVT
jgi:hypothetical protein